MLKLDPTHPRHSLILRWVRIGLALLAGAGTALAHPPFGVLPGLLGYPLLMLLAERSTTARGAFWMGWLAGSPPPVSTVCWCSPPVSPCWSGCVATS